MWCVSWRHPAALGTSIPPVMYVAYSRKCSAESVRWPNRAFSWMAELRLSFPSSVSTSSPPFTELKHHTVRVCVHLVRSSHLHTPLQFKLCPDAGAVGLSHANWCQHWGSGYKPHHPVALLFLVTQLESLCALEARSCWNICIRDRVESGHFE